MTTGTWRPVTRRAAYHLDHRVAGAVAEVQELRGAALLEVLQGEEVSLPEVVDVDVVSDRGSVGRVVVVAEHRDVRPLPQGGLEHEGNDVGLGIVVLPVLRGGARGVEGARGPARSGTAGP
jgi:hypothetical protein